MPNRCVAYSCSNTTNVAGISTYYFPKDSCLKKKFVDQVKKTRDKWSEPTAHSVLCCNHFSQDCFEGGFELGKGFGIKKKRKLKENAVPTIFNRNQRDDCDSTTSADKEESV
ncbi:PREDICTED: THAP domain-containing protein 10-like [Amphimedon queenslandica]|uniref:THAP-type domain-containing protein n=1 Tax=Amphimedon queenslandica TaxID=400682 RepID=A0A1X7U6U6_AMPQE|nr:PREDICTED: THAP domain-containing protein 10-like [Amphimedon queenslandica]|eukprot:XP_011405984.1 PREDICTED: THAP domain-containing protein 10-like [Amphimedon queenslandica]